MFQSARVKLTLWYLLIIMLLSILFSAVIYALINQEYTRFEQIQKIRQERSQQLGPVFEEFRRDRMRRGLDAPSMPPATESEAINEARTRLMMILGSVNLGILLLAGLLGYFLAGRTLRPIKEMLDEQNRFITDASHELRTPLTSLKSEIEVYLRDKKITLGEAKGLLESNLEEVNKLQYLSDNLIKLAQYQKSNEVIFMDVSLKDITQESARKVIKLAKNKEINILVKVKEANFKGDKLKLVELLVIFLDNAIKYSPKKSTVNLSAKAVNNMVLLEIKDQGMGISESDIPHLFDRFFRGDSSRTKIQTSGYGLGLSIAKQIVEKHNGSIKVQSVVDKGTSFKIRLPIKHS